METEEVNTNFVTAALLRFKAFVELIDEAIGRRAKKNILALIGEGIDNKTENAELLSLAASKILKGVAQSNYLTDKLIEFGDREVAYTVLSVSLARELAGKPGLFSRDRLLIFRVEEKERLIDLLLSGEDKLRIFCITRWLLCLAGAIPYKSQELLCRAYLELHGEFTTPDDFLDVYEMWEDLAPYLREDLRRIIKNALVRFRFRLWKKEDAGGVEVASGYGGGPKPGADSN